eukprot:6835083-Alexandrium_andersonii.AAC.1
MFGQCVVWICSSANLSKVGPGGPSTFGAEGAESPPTLGPKAFGEAARAKSPYETCPRGQSSPYQGGTR